MSQHSTNDAASGSDRSEGQPEPSIPAAETAASESASSSSSVSSTLYSAAPNNAAEAEDALELGRQCMRRGELAAAERLVAKAVRLRPNTESMQLLASLQRQRQGQAGREQRHDAAAQAAASSAPAAAASSSHNRPAPSYPPRPHAPGAAGAAAAAAPAAGAAAGDEPGLLFPWRRCSFTLPAFLQPAGEAIPRVLSFPYPAFVYVPPAQRRPLLLVWSAVFVLCLARLSGWMDNAEELSFSRGRRYPQRSSRPAARGEDHSDNIGSIHHDDDGTAWHNSRAARHGQQQHPSFLNLNNFFTLLPFVFFFLMPMLQRYRQQQNRQH